MPRGGAREGAGRPRGSPNRISTELQNLIVEKGLLSPGRVMLEAMWHRYSAAARVQANSQLANTPAGEELIERHLERAAHFAQAAAPYVHTRLSSVSVQSDEGLPAQPGADGRSINGRAVKYTPQELARLTDAELASLAMPARATEAAVACSPTTPCRLSSASSVDE